MSWNQKDFAYPDRWAARDKEAWLISNRNWDYTVSFYKHGLSNNPDDVLITNQLHDEHFIAGLKQPPMLDLPMVMSSKPGGKYMSGAKRIIPLPEPIIAGTISVQAGDAEETEALLKAAKEGEAWIFLGGMMIDQYEQALAEHGTQIAALETLPFPFHNGKTGRPSGQYPFPRYPDHYNYGRSAIFARDLTITKRQFAKTINGGYITTLSYSGIWQADRAAQI